MNSEYVSLTIWVVVIGAIFLFLWRKGYLLRFSSFWSETIEELKKCTWPTVDELKSSTGIILVAILMLGLFTVVVDYVISGLLALVI